MTRILIVEDDSSARGALELDLLRAGHEVRGAGDATEALDIAQTFPPELLLCDWMLPGDADGLDLASELHDRLPELCIVFMTGLPDGYRAAARGLRLPIAEVLVKPLSLQHVRRAVSRALEERSPS